MQISEDNIDFDSVIRDFGDLCKKTKSFIENLYLRNKQTNHNLTSSQNIQDLPYKEYFILPE